MLSALAFPNFDPVLFEIGPVFGIGPFAIRWYALAYIVGLLLGWRYCLYLAARPPRLVSRLQLDDFLLWATLGVVLGGRLGYVLFYQPSHFLEQPLDILQVWQGGMSFHGGMLGVIIAMLLYARRIGVPFFTLMDPIACVAPIGLFFGRLANFINGELWGRVAPEVPWAMVFPTGGPEPRHPSQLYQAAMEGVLLFLLLNGLRWTTKVMDKPGILSGVFLIGYGTARIVGELFRQPDPQIGYLIGGTTMGQWLSLPMVLGGIGLVLWARRQPA